MGGGRLWNPPLCLYCLIAHIHTQGLRVKLWTPPLQGEGDPGGSDGPWELLLVCEWVQLHCGEQILENGWEHCFMALNLRRKYQVVTKLFSKGLVKRKKQPAKLLLGYLWETIDKFRQVMNSLCLDNFSPKIILELTPLNASTGLSLLEPFKIILTTLWKRKKKKSISHLSRTPGSCFRALEKHHFSVWCYFRDTITEASGEGK